ncbi:MAG: AAA family ATPase, partial [Rhodospirillales bacterium]|nr:AAA family ATPase [Rhodospirillales bacterium]
MDPAEDQKQVIRFMACPESHGGIATRVERVETHISQIFLAGDRAYKLKRAVRFPYLDFTTRDLRRAACEAEVAVNRRTAPELYKGVVAVTRTEDGALRLGGDGEAVEWLVEMTRFDQDAMFDRLARTGAMDRHLMEELAEVIARFHQAAEESLEFGGHPGMAAIVDSNAQCFADFGAPVLDAGRVESLNAATRGALDDLGALLEIRRKAGRVRHCHGDLHLRNIVLLDGRPTLFDAIEFSQSMARIDTLYDLAFLLMDLEHLGLRIPANVVLNRYLDITADDDGLAALPLFCSVRAAVRAHVGAAAAASLSAAEEAGEQGAEASRYLDSAVAYLEPRPPRLVAIGGLSGSGKSRTARQVAPYVGLAPGARVVRSDVIRKRLAGVDAYARLGPEGYAAELTARTYQALVADAARVLKTGHSVIADAVFARPDERRAIAAVAARAGVPFTGLWLESPPDV